MTKNYEKIVKKNNQSISATFEPWPSEQEKLCAKQRAAFSQMIHLCLAFSLPGFEYQTFHLSYFQI